jgi:hypothetical protein
MCYILIVGLFNSESRAPVVRAPMVALSRGVRVPGYGPKFESALLNNIIPYDSGVTLSFLSLGFLNKNS